MTFLGYGDSGKKNSQKQPGCPNDTIDKTNQNTHAVINDNSALAKDGDPMPPMAALTEGQKTNDKRERQKRNRKSKRAPLLLQDDLGSRDAPLSPSPAELKQLTPSGEHNEGSGATTSNSQDAPAGPQMCLAADKTDYCALHANFDGPWGLNSPVRSEPSDLSTNRHMYGPFAIMEFDSEDPWLIDGEEEDALPPVCPSCWWGWWLP